ncbi:biopolymer transporter ExbD [Asticcacaulis sp. AC460]|uniref:ExbD/TolR family protein n=1 Tax=Asticcacaulis sp. AC460 TaxID=1282360 RepID=UPI0003C3D0FC|nr:biopolymer transporter ExbD [Asticcacaulis sp. AC460]ESQ88443.1 biopolymer transporter ExbD [Asticcacaulis sp. AC460]
MPARIHAKTAVYKIEQNSDINVTPFVDVMLVLLIIFMVSIPVATKAVKLDMPPPSLEATGKTPTFISIEGPGELYISGQRTSLTTLDADLRMALQSDHPTEERVLVRGRADIQYDAFMDVLNELNAHGYTRIGLMNEDID